MEVYICFQNLVHRQSPDATMTSVDTGHYGPSSQTLTFLDPEENGSL